MNFLKKCSISCLYSLGFIFLLTFILTFFSYIDFVNNGWFIFFMIFNLVLSVFIGAFIMGKKSSKKGWLEGLKFGLIFLFIISLVNYLGFESSFNMKFVIFGLIILASSMLGGMIGIGFRKEK